MGRECETFVEGGGCAAPRSTGCCPEPIAVPIEACDTGEDCSASDSAPVVDPYLHGGGSTCSHLPVASPAVLVAIVLLAIRRWAPAALVLLVIPGALAADVESFQVLDGGPVPGLQDPTLGVPWTTRVWGAGTISVQPIWYRRPATTDLVVERLVSGEGTVSLQLGDSLVAGFSLPGHYADMASGRDGGGLGDRVAFARIPMARGRKGTVAADLRLQIPFPSFGEVVDDPAAPWTRAPSMSVGGLAARSFEHGWIGARLSVRLQQNQVLPGLVWGSRWEASAGARRDFGPVGLGTSLVGSAPLNVFGRPTASWPLEMLGFTAVRAGGLEVQAGGGGGLSRGLGTPAIRVFATAGVVWGDRDEDGLIDPRDLCPRRPEDVDAFRDGDGCPEPDNDRDGIVDADDACPLDPEVFNQWKDTDGCPDTVVEWRITVRSPRDLQEYTLVLDDETSRRVESLVRVSALPGTHTLEVRAEGHEPVTRTVVLEDELHETVVDLEPIEMGALVVALVSSEDGSPLQGTVRTTDAEYEVGVGGRPIPVRIGKRFIEGRAPGHDSATERVFVRLDRVDSVTLELDPDAPLADPPEVVFDLGSSKLRGDGLELVDRLARWLSDNPDIELLRVEGHADEIGGSAYNLALSQRRAETVVQALVERGIPRTRLQAIGSGEGRAWLELEPEVDATVAGQALREVSFQVLVWAE